MIHGIKIKGSLPQYEFILSDADAVFLTGGRGSGKTRAGTEKSKLFILRNLGCTICATAPTYKNVFDILIPMYEEVFRECKLYLPEEGLGKLIRSTSADGPKLILRQGMGTILFRSTEEPDRLRGMNLAAVHMDEGAQSPEMAYKLIQGCLRQPGVHRQIWVTTTPLGPEHWVSRAIQAEGSESFNATIYHNRKFLPEDFIKRMEREYTGEFAKRELLGEIVTVMGQCRFDVTLLRRMGENAIPPIYTDGFVEVYRDPVVGRRYIAGGDGAEGLKGRDRSCCQILDAQRGEQVCVIHGQIPPAEFAFLVDKWCRKYNNALYNEPHDPIDVAVHEKLDDLGYERRPKPWKTTGLWKPMAEAELAEAISGGGIVLYRKNTIDECCSYIKDDKGRCHAAEGCHDDEVAALMAAWQARKEAGAFAPTVESYDYVTWR